MRAPRISARRSTSRELTEPEIADRGIGRKFQKPTVFEQHTVFENLELARKADKRVWPTLRAKLDSTAHGRILAIIGHDPARARRPSDPPVGCRTGRSSGSRSACC